MFFYHHNLIGTAICFTVYVANFMHYFHVLLSFPHLQVYLLWDLEALSWGIIDRRETL